MSPFAINSMYVRDQRMTRFSVFVFLLVALAITARGVGEDTAQRLTAETAELSDEYLKRWTPGGNTNVADLPYPHITAKFQTETDSDWRDDRWQQTQKGPFVSHSILLPNYEVGPKLSAVAAGPGKYLLFDMATASFVAGVTEGELRTDAARFGLLNRPKLVGHVEFFVPVGRAWRTAESDAPIVAGECDYQGLSLHGARVVLASKIVGTEVLESPVPDDTHRRLTREIEVAPHSTTLWLALAAGEGNASVASDGRSAEWVGTQGRRQRITLDAGSPGVALVHDGAEVLLCWPAASTATSARVSYWNLNATAGEPSATSDNSHEKLPDLRSLRSPGPRRWGEPLVTKGVLADVSGDVPFVVDRIEPPRANPFAALFFITGVDFFASGAAAVCTAHGDVWIIRGIDESLQHVTWQRFATGLYQPLGLEIIDDQVIVLGRDQLTRLHDENADGEADFYESFNHDLVIYGTPHAYAMRLERTPDGSFVFCKSGEAPHGSAVLRVSPDGDRLEVLARGFRHPFGLGCGPHGEITVADNEGNWVPSSKIDLIQQDGFYGFLGSAESAGESPRPARPLCYLPKVADNSCGGQFWHTSDHWGPYHQGGMFHFSWGRRTLHAVLTQRVGTVWQAATVEVPGVLLQAGPAEAEFHPRDGQLYVVGLDGWQTGAEVDGAFERIRYTGQPARLPTAFAVHTNGIRICFEEPIDPQSVWRADAVQVEQWNYRWSSTYGSYHYSVAEPKRVGHDVVAVQQADLSDDGRQLFLSIGGMQTVDQVQVSLNLRTTSGQALACNLYGTINALAPTYDLPARSPLRQLLSKDNLLAWCIVPFDARRRGPEERAAMLGKLGIHRVAYDWRAEHVPTFDAELAAYARHGITLHAFWMPVDTETPLGEAHWPVVLELVRRHNVRPQLWVMLNNGLVDGLPKERRVQRAADILAPVARAAAERNCRIGCYNHGGWWGWPENQIRVVQALRARGIDNVGLVYNFHHGHEHVADFPRLAREMQPYLLTVDINGMRDGGPQILPVGQGEHEAAMLQALIAAGYQGPIGILHHRDGLDAEQGLEENLHGIDQLLGTR